jgi:biofilm PGA synthesis N-glycosyltransferase PgaC
LETLFLLCALIIFYTYLGYPVLIWLAARIRKLFRSGNRVEEAILPSVAIVIPAYNEANCIEQKLLNCLTLDYPANKFFIIVVADGSVDETPAIVSRFSSVTLLHARERRGKATAIQHAMQEVDADLTIFTDANTMLNREAIRLLSRHFSDPKVGAVAGEKRIAVTANTHAAVGEGWYWYYESLLKQCESDFYSVMGAAGELFCIRTELYEAVEPDTLVDDLAISLSISLKGFRILYEPAAFAVEAASQTAGQELERKTRIAAGGIQTIARYGWKLLLAAPLLAFEYTSHRVLRWILVPYLLLLAFATSIAWVFMYGWEDWMSWLFVLQLFFYLVAALGWLMEAKKIKAGWFYMPFYFCLLHYAMIAGTIRYWTGKQTVLWKKADR